MTSKASLYRRAKNPVPGWKLKKWWMVSLLALAVNLCALAWWADWTVSAHAEQMAQHPRQSRPQIALVLGTAPNLGDGRPNAFYWQRLRAAAKLYMSGEVAGILVSGDNGRRDYDEPSTMRRDLASLGVPLAAITRDYAGFSTFDGVVRAREVFALNEVIIISQGFHVERALFLAEATGLRARAFDAGEISGVSGWRVRLREIAARLSTMGDLALWGREPRFLGPIEEVHVVAAR